MMAIMPLTDLEQQIYLSINLMALTDCASLGEVQAFSITDSGSPQKLRSPHSTYIMPSHIGEKVRLLFSQCDLNYINSHSGFDSCEIYLTADNFADEVTMSKFIKRSWQQGAENLAEKLASVTNPDDKSVIIQRFASSLGMPKAADILSEGPRNGFSKAADDS